MNKDVLVVGLGEVGSAVYKLENEAGNHPWALDIKALITPGTSVSYEVMHVCIPFSENFEKIVLEYDKKYRPGIIIIHSTVPVGTTEKINKQTDTYVAHSPVRGIHPNLYEGLLTFTKYVGSHDETAKTLAAEHLAGLKLNVATMNNSDETELTKLLDTSYYGWCIMFAKEAKKYCDLYGADYHKVFTHANMTYNQGYTMLGKEKFVRPLLIPPDGTGVGGHCVQQNYELLTDSLLKKAFKEINESDYASTQ